MGGGLRALHDALPVKSCPFSWSVEDRLAEIDRRASSGLLAPAKWHDVHQSLDVGQAPNTLLTSDGRWSGHVDLGALGNADRWADLAIDTWSADWNYGTGWEAELLAAYGVVPDRDRMRYYRLPWDLGP